MQLFASWNAPITPISQLHIILAYCRSTFLFHCKKKSITAFSGINSRKASRLIWFSGKHTVSSNRILLVAPLLKQTSGWFFYAALRIDCFCWTHIFWSENHIWRPRPLSVHFQNIWVTTFLKNLFMQMLTLLWTRVFPSRNRRRRWHFGVGKTCQNQNMAHSSVSRQ